MVQTYYQEFQIRFTCRPIPAGAFWSVMGSVLTVNVGEAAAQGTVVRLNLRDGTDATAINNNPARLIESETISNGGSTGSPRTGGDFWFRSS